MTMAEANRTRPTINWTLQHQKADESLGYVKNVKKMDFLKGLGLNEATQRQGTKTLINPVIHGLGIMILVCGAVIWLALMNAR